jgi:hypothetical protein
VKYTALESRLRQDMWIIVTDIVIQVVFAVVRVCCVVVPKLSKLFSLLNLGNSFHEAVTLKY